MFLDKPYTKAQIHNIIDKANAKLQDLKQDIIITTGIIFTSDKDFFYVFNVFRDKKIIDKVRANNNVSFERVFKDLTDKYEVNIIYDYSDLTYNQLKYLVNDLDIPNKLEQTELKNIYLDCMLTW